MTCALRTAHTILISEASVTLAVIFKAHKKKNQRGIFALNIQCFWSKAEELIWHGRPTDIGHQAPTVKNM